MEQTVKHNTSTELSPEFLEWLDGEKQDSLRHQLRIFKATLLMLFGTALFLLKLQPNWLFDILGVAELLPK